MAGPVVLVPLDGSKSAPAAVSIAERLAELERTSVQIAVSGETAPSILAASADARLIVMCVQATATAPDDALGAAALAVSREARCPVVLIDPTRTPTDWTPKLVLAAHDGSPAVSAALAPATKLAREAGAEFVVLQVATGVRALEAGSMASPPYLDQVQHGWPVWSGEFMARLASLCPLADVRVQLLVGHGELASETLRVAKAQSADLIVLPWKNPWTASHADTLKALVRDAPCPIMTTRVPGP